MGSLFLEAFLKVLLRKGDFKIDAEKCEVKTEVSGNGRMDILITDRTYAICIENKIYADDQYKQLQRYATYLEKEYPEHCKIFYLTLDGHSASDDSGKDVKYTPISHSIDIVNWLDECIKIAAEKPMLRETLCQYRNHIKNLTGTNMEKKYMDDLIKLINSSSENYSSATQIAGIFYMAQETILKTRLPSFLEELRSFIQEKLSGNEIKFESNISKQKESGFYFSVESCDFVICFEFEGNNYNSLFFGIWIKENARDKMAHLANLKPEGFDSDCKNDWIAYKYVKELWGDDIVEKFLFDKEKLIADYKATIDEIIPYVKECIKLNSKP